MRSSALFAAALLLGALACRGERDADVDTTTAPFDTGMVALGGDTALREKSAPSAPAAPAATPNGKALGAFIAASQHEIQHGRLATQKGSTQTVRDLGRTISRDHDDFVQNARELGARLSILPATSAPDTVIADHPDAMRELRANAGVAFDRAFLQHEVEYHRWLIDLVNRTMLPYATNEELRTFLEQAVPAFDAHMKGAQDLLAKLPSP